MRARLAELGVAGPAWLDLPSSRSAAPPRWRFADRVGWPVVLKAISGGYDGKGVWMVDRPPSASGCWPPAPGCWSRRRADIDASSPRWSLVRRSGRARPGRWWRPSSRRHLHRGDRAGAASCRPPTPNEASALALRIAEELDVVGVLAVELFVERSGRLLVNELAMRPHNSGHWTIEGARTSQFEQHLRAVLDYPLGQHRADRAGGGDGQRARRPGRRRARAGRAGAPPDGALAGRQDPPVRQGVPARAQGRSRDRAGRATWRRSGSGPGRRRTTCRWAMSGGGRAWLRTALVGVIMGSDSDFTVMSGRGRRRWPSSRCRSRSGWCRRTAPRRAWSSYARPAAGRGLRVIIAGAGGAAHLPGMVASLTPLPVIGVPVPLKHLDGLDSLLSIVQMPAGVPVATVSIGGARNAGLLAVRILARRPTQSSRTGCWPSSSSLLRPRTARTGRCPSRYVRSAGDPPAPCDPPSGSGGPGPPACRPLTRCWPAVLGAGSRRSPALDRAGRRWSPWPARCWC